MCRRRATGEALPHRHAREDVIDAFRRGLRELGYVEGESFAIDYRSADGHDERFPALAAELVQMRVDLIVVRGTPAALAAKNATRTIPVIVTGVGDPVGQGVVASLARPGANITGLSAAVTEIYPKRVHLLKELVPKATRIGDVRKVEDLEPAFDTATRHRADALIVGIDTLTQANQRLIVALAARHRLPAMYASTELRGGLISYGVSYPEMYRRAADFAHKRSSTARSRPTSPSKNRRSWSSSSIRRPAVPSV